MSSGHKDKQHDGDKRRQTRSLSPIPTRRIYNDDGANSAKKSRISLRNVKCCTEIELLPHEHHCDGCQRVKSSSRAKAKPRHELTSRGMQGFKVWTKTKDEVSPAMMPHWTRIIEFLAQANNMETSAVVNKTTNVAAPPTKAVTPAPRNEGDGTIYDVNPINGKKQKKERNITYELNKFYSKRQEFSFWIPSSHTIENAAHVSRWQNDSETLNNIRKKLKRKQFNTSSSFSQALFAIACSAVPAMALSAAQFLFPIVVMAFLHDTGIFEGMDYRFATSFPSDNTL